MLVNSFEKFKKSYPDVKVIFAETYRSNKLQEQYYYQGASKIKKNGTHHFGISADCMFRRNGVSTYHGDYKTLRRCFSENGLTLLGLRDMGHIQFIHVKDQNDLIAGCK